MFVGFPDLFMRRPKELRPGNLRVHDNTISFDYAKLLTFQAVMDETRAALTILAEVYGQEPYSLVNVRGKQVLDIGANIGDTAVYFFLKGAKQVVSIEENPTLAELASRNVSRNIPDANFTILTERAGGSMSLANMVEIYGIRDAVLKIDCEGCEYQLVADCAIETLLRFEQIILEYHYGHNELERKLRKSGFKTERHYFSLAYRWDKSNPDPRTKIGFLVARRNNRT